MSDLQQAIGILGGTFDPIHFGHLRTALELQQALNLAEVRLIPCYQPVHRQQPIASPEHRLAMLQIAIEDEPALLADDCEIARKNPSYMVHTLEILHEKLPQTPLCLIMGIDALINFHQWHRWQDILTLAHLVVVARPKHHLPDTGIIADLIKERLRNTTLSLHESLSGSIVLYPVTPMDISATDIRQQIAMGINPRYLLPESVYKYIQQHGLYTKSGI